MSFFPESLLSVLEPHGGGGDFVLALSGGMDSMVLLHALCRLRDAGVLPGALRAVHVDHGLHAESAAWAAHCGGQCESRAVTLAVERVTVKATHGEGLEAAARRARHAAFARHVGPDDTLLTAHHRDDQIETFFLALSRGAGVAGLRGMPPVASFGAGRLLRPLLGVPRAALREWAVAEHLVWVEDPSNADCVHERNFIRHEILPRLTARRAGVGDCIARSMAHLVEASALLDECARADLLGLVKEGALDIAGLTGLAPPRQRNALRAFIRDKGFPAPDHRRLARVLDEVACSRPDAQPLVRWQGVEARRYRGRLYIGEAIMPRAAAAIAWPVPDRSLDLPEPLGRLELAAVPQGAISAASLADAALRVSFRQGGERLAGGDGHTHALKKLLQEQGIPPWLRAHVPLLYADDRLVAVAGGWIDRAFAATPGEPALCVRWNTTLEGIPGFLRGPPADAG